jgi:hypothetical protein
MKFILKAFLRAFGFEIYKVKLPPEVSSSHRKTIYKVEDFTMTSRTRLVSLINSVEYVISRNIEGDFVECGVWRGGSIMAIAQTLVDLGIKDRKIWLYDTFDGMTQPTIHDVAAKTKKSAQDLLSKSKKIAGKNNIHAFATIDDVKANLLSIDYPIENFNFIIGPVEETLAAAAPNSIALLRLDTDWYESTLTELVHLFPKVSIDGVIIIDDFGDWEGSSKAVTEYFGNIEKSYLMNIIDSAGRLIIKN